MPHRIELNECAVLTPPGRGAVAVIGVFGPDAVERLGPLFQSASNKRLNLIGKQQIFYGHWLATGEDVVVVCEHHDRIEVHCHGGRSAPAAIIKSLLQAGFEEISPESVAQRLWGGQWQAELASELAKANTETIAKILLQQLAIVEQQMASLRRILAIDPNRVITEIETMLQWEAFGSCLTRPRSVVLCGQPNVGKSSLINAMVGFNRAIVHETPGTTRDIVSQMTAINGWPIKLTDTAGLRSSENEIERIGVSRSETEIEHADFVVLVLSAIGPITSADQELAERIIPDLIVLNKSDLIPSNGGISPDGDRHLIGPKQLLTSTKTGDGIPELIQAIGDLLTPKAFPRNTLVPINSRQCGLLRTLRQHMVDNDIKTVESLMATMQ